jgi:hypothetical protein
VRVALDTNILAYAEGVNGAPMKKAALGLVQGLPEGTTEQGGRASLWVEAQREEHPDRYSISDRREGPQGGRADRPS